MTDAFDRLVALRPPVPDEVGWATSPAGREVLDRVHATPPLRRRWWQRRRFVVPTVVIGLGAAVGAGVAFAPADRTASSDVPIVCVATTSDGSPSLTAIEASVGSPHATIVAQCNEQLTLAGRPTAVDFAECVFGVGRDQVGGAEAAVPSQEPVTPANHAAVCQAAGYEPAS